MFYSTKYQNGWPYMIFCFPIGNIYWGKPTDQGENSSPMKATGILKSLAYQNKMKR